MKVDEPDPILEFLLVDEQDKAGIMPMVNQHTAMRDYIDRLPPNEARALKRKFRKLWRRCLRNICGGKMDPRLGISETLGVGKEQPTPEQLNARREQVFFLFLRKAQRRRKAV